MALVSYLFGVMCLILGATACHLVNGPRYLMLLAVVVLAAISVSFALHQDRERERLESALEANRREELARIKERLRAARNPMLVAIDEAEFSA